jgi:hypothetical protein
VGPHARLHVPPLERGRALDVALTFAPFVHPPTQPQQRIIVRAGGRRLAQWRLVKEGVVTLHVLAPPDVRGPRGGLNLQFELPDAAAPAWRVPGASDPRPLAIKLMKATVTG